MAHHSRLQGGLGRGKPHLAEARAPLLLTPVGTANTKAHGVSLSSQPLGSPQSRPTASLGLGCLAERPQLRD